MMADFYSYRPLPPSPDEIRGLFADMLEKQRVSGVTWFRMTYFNDEVPSETHPHGLYVQGWFNRPKDEEFEFPLVAARGNHQEGGHD